MCPRISISNVSPDSDQTALAVQILVSEATARTGTAFRHQMASALAGSSTTLTNTMRMNTTERKDEVHVRRSAPVRLVHRRKSPYYVQDPDCDRHGELTKDNSQAAAKSTRGKLQLRSSRATQAGCKNRQPKEAPDQRRGRATTQRQEQEAAGSSMERLQDQASQTRTFIAAARHR